tara:strand:+ start:8200 stop:9270 length:1071 start_codon:yes stop_codon:yes gene_type:complete
MAIYRGSGGSGDATNDASISAVTALTIRAEDSRDAAASSAGAASASASAAAASEAGVDADRVAAETAKTAAQTAKTNAETAETNAETAETNAETAETNAANSATAAASSASSITGAVTSSASSATAAATSATASATSAVTSGTQATTATTQAGISTTKAGEAASSATAAAASASSITGAVTASANSATAAAASYDAFDDRYLGAKSSSPSVDNDGDALITGAQYFDTTANEQRVYTGSIWKATGSAVNGTTSREVYTATSGQATYAVVYDSGFVDVYQNGVKLQTATDFTATSGTDIVLAVGAVTGDIIDIVAYGAFAVANTYTKTEADSKFAADVEGGAPDSVYLTAQNYNGGNP